MLKEKSECSETFILYYEHDRKIFQEKFDVHAQLFDGFWIRILWLYLNKTGFIESGQSSSSSPYKKLCSVSDPDMYFSKVRYGSA